MGPKSQEQVAEKLKGKKLIQEKKKAAALAEKRTLPKSTDTAGKQEPPSSSLSPKKFSPKKANKQMYFTEHDFERVSKAGHGLRRVEGFGGPSFNTRNTEISGGNFERERYDV